jgi:hypothetical protein
MAPKIAFVSSSEPGAGRQSADGSEGAGYGRPLISKMSSEKVPMPAMLIVVNTRKSLQPSEEMRFRVTSKRESLRGLGSDSHALRRN